jgi:SAM-dependent MidA family methyltransferase
MDPNHGYYMRKDPFGAEGDFVTAPEISQMFGEMIGLFFMQAWEDRGRPKPFHLAEIGPGRGTLMADMLRAAKVRPEFLAAAKVSLIEESPALRAIQEKTLSDARVRWVSGFEEFSGAPLFVAANEFLDALPAHQFVKSKRGWHARMVAKKGDELVFALSEECEPDSFVPEPLRGAPEGSIWEIGTEAIAAMRTIAGKIADHGGVALVIDYGYSGPALGDTFQAVKAHRYADPLAEPGEADLTFHVDFGALAVAAREAGACVYGPQTQGAFLSELGIGLRAERLKRTNPARANEIDAAFHRLVGKDQMGALFKAMAICNPSRPMLPGLPC